MMIFEGHLWDIDDSRRRYTNNRWRLKESIENRGPLKDFYGQKMKHEGRIFAKGGA